ncbi:MAG: DNA replication/repair protein RecF [Gammaproteobacteria bacterium]
MWLSYLEINNIRCHGHLEAALGRTPWVVLAGANGAGKTSLMEALYLAVRGRSFRPVSVREIIRTGSDTAEIILTSENSGTHRLGARFTSHSRELHLDGKLVRGLAEASVAVPVEYVGSVAHRLVDGPPADRRRFLDWGLFHVEPRFLNIWRLWHRAHRQRNEWLRRCDYPASAGWTAAVAQHGEALSRMRSELVRRLADQLHGDSWLKIQGRTPRLRFNPGWRADSLLDALQETTERERRLGRAVVGPQYDDWTLDFEGLRVGQLSRGQAKLASFFLWRELGRMMQDAHRSAILLVDDFLADLDEAATEQAIAALDGAAGQVWLAVRNDRLALRLPGEALRFHVEPGDVQLFQ